MVNFTPTALAAQVFAESNGLFRVKGLAGRISGVIVNNRSGEPGRDDAVMYIRGRSTLGDNSPLIIIDGIAGRGDEFSRGGTTYTVNYAEKTNKKLIII